MQRPKTLEETMAETFSRNNSPVEPPPSSVTPPVSHLVDPSASAVSSVAETAVTPVNVQTIVQVNSQVNTTKPSLVEQLLVREEIPTRLKADVDYLRQALKDSWQPVPKLATRLPGLEAQYWMAYAQAWHILEDEIWPHLDKDSRLALRYCYRQAFGNPQAEGRFFAGQTILAQEVGLCKRRIQDIMEIFNILGWICKVAHYNRGGRKGTDYEMHLPAKASELFNLS